MAVLRPKQIIQAYVEKNPEGTYSDFVKETKARISNPYFYLIRRTVLDGKGIGGITRRKANIQYVQIFSRDTKSLSEQSKTLLKEFIDCLNATQKSRLELVEYKNPESLEVRQRR